MDGQPLFPGDSDVDQLYIIQKLLGPITPHQNSVFMRNARFAGFKFGDELTLHPNRLESRYAKQLGDGTMPRAALDLMKQCLQMEPKERLTIKACMQHPFFAGLQERQRSPAPRVLPPPLRSPAAKRSLSAQHSGSSMDTHDVLAGHLGQAMDRLRDGPPAKRQVCECAITRVLEDESSKEANAISISPITRSIIRNVGAGLTSGAPDGIWSINSFALVSALGTLSTTAHSVTPHWLGAWPLAGTRRSTTRQSWRAAWLRGKGV